MAKKVGIIFGQEDTFPWAFIDKVNELGNGKVVAEPVKIDKVQQGIDYGYHVIIDRMSQGVPFYRSYLKNAALMGTAVINNPFWFSADEKFFNNCLAMELGVPVPKTVLLPSNVRPDDTTEKSFRNLAGPLDWDYIFNYIGFPAYMKPFDGGGWKDVYKVENPDSLFASHAETGQLVMMLQEEIVFDDYFRVYCLGQKYVHIMPYDPRKPFHERYVSEIKATGEERKKLLEKVHDYTLKLNQALGYDFNTVEFAVRDGIPYAIDFCNPAPDADVHSVGQENFDWIVEHSAKYAIEKAETHKAKQNNTSWGSFVKNSISPAGRKRGKVNLKTADEVKKAAATRKRTTTTKKKTDSGKAPVKPKAAAKSKSAAANKSTAKAPAKGKIRGKSSAKKSK
ncbi:ATP-grasp domain-containing protein [Pricia mediterranea]|uniref:ATP-grasp domain-containing protein n=1 Tax=Pricia mediterranea TaxID=3076079 RepID=UPI003D77EA80